MAINIAVQLFTVRKYMKTPDQIRTTLQRLNEMGINHIEAARIRFTMEEAEVIRDVCEKQTICISSTQIKYKRIIEDFDNIVALHHLWACEYIGVSVLPTKYLIQGEIGLKKFGLCLNELGERLRYHGLKLLFHHHNMEFFKYGDKTGLEILMEVTNPLYVNLMMDTYWTQRGGKNPVDQIIKYKERVKVIHLRDYMIDFSWLKAGYFVRDCALGDGNLDIKGIIHTANEIGIPFLPIEQNTKRPFDELARSISYIKDHIGQI